MTGLNQNGQMKQAVNVVRHEHPNQLVDHEQLRSECSLFRLHERVFTVKLHKTWVVMGFLSMRVINLRII